MDGGVLPRKYSASANAPAIRTIAATASHHIGMEDRDALGSLSDAVVDSATGSRRIGGDFGVRMASGKSMAISTVYFLRATAKNAGLWKALASARSRPLTCAVESNRRLATSACVHPRWSRVARSLAPILVHTWGFSACVGANGESPELALLPGGGTRRFYAYGSRCDRRTGGGCDRGREVGAIAGREVSAIVDAKSMRSRIGTRCES